MGQDVEVEVALGSVTASQMHGQLAVGDRVTVSVRPEHVQIVATGAPAVDGASNVVRARIEEALNIGASLRCVAQTADGTRVVALLQRATLDIRIGLGDDVDLTWSARAAHVYGEGGGVESRPDNEGTKEGEGHGEPER
jgi:ABC-type Fe3+/spermidine/putrescine transport system ATPase subunit